MDFSSFFPTPHPEIMIIHPEWKMTEKHDAITYLITYLFSKKAAVHLTCVHLKAYR